MAGSRKRVPLLCPTAVFRELDLGFRDSKEIADRLTQASQDDTPEDFDPDVFTAEDVETMLRRFARGQWVQLRRDGWHLLEDGRAYLLRYAEAEELEGLFKKPR